MNSADLDTKQTTTSELIKICVRDENRDVEKHFFCEKRQLVSKMRYFEQYLPTDEAPNESSGKSKNEHKKKREGMDMHVYCDIVVFEWLMEYINNHQPKLQIDNIISILVSADFLQIQQLLQECIDYFCKHINDVLLLPIDLSCLHEKLLHEISRHITLHQFLHLKDDKNKLTANIACYKLQDLLHSYTKTSMHAATDTTENVEEDNELYYCVYCKELYTMEQYKKIECHQSPTYVAFHGQVTAKHCAHKKWDINKYLLCLRLHSHSWKEIFWHLWSLTRPPLFCTQCQSYFVLPHFNHCATHSKLPTLD
ncbi:hypothetical protein RFI_23177 [Reticulomyxa filosa]|uniref:SANT and BTB domain-containing protein n=1 Tax=Reticulomyxa filosa TaxID=46433 RepID=X6MM76_RETFI|nr:hypothetical protein RFI_23177 [Reticulomyxa filosa]|eukprot:ETO14190.1 hypothetical protein RFI_23177 [Reticulomyxa filosa]